jgi:hypothetical protein
MITPIANGNTETVTAMTVIPVGGGMRRKRNTRGVSSRQIMPVIVAVNNISPGKACQVCGELSKKPSTTLTQAPTISAPSVATIVNIQATVAASARRSSAEGAAWDDLGIDRRFRFGLRFFATP